MHDRMTDEMIARYPCGKATSEEEAIVLDYIAESDEHLDDFIAIATVIELHEDGRRSVQRKPRVHQLWLAISAAAVVALLVGVGIAWLHSAGSGEAIGVEQAPAYAVQDTIGSTEMEESL